MRRILVVPSISSSSVVNNNAYNEIYSLSETIASFDEKSYWYIIVPPWIRDGLRAHERLHYVHVETTRDPALNDVIGYSAYDLATWFARRGGRYIVDAVITNCVQFSLQLGQLLTDPSRDRIPIILRDINWSHLQKGKDKEAPVAVAMNFATSLFGFVSSHHKDSVVDFLGKYLRPSLIDHFLKRAFLWPISSDLGILDDCSEVDKGEKITAFLGGNFKYNNAHTVLSIYRRLFALGIDVAIASVDPLTKVKKTYSDRDVSYITEVNAGLPLNSYYLEAAKAHLFVSAIENEIAFIDEVRRLILGQVGIFPYRDFVVEFLGKDYPFYYNDGNTNEACELAIWIKDNYREATKQIEKFVQVAREKISEKMVFGIAWESIKERIDLFYRVNKRSSLFDSVSKVAKGLGDEFAMAVFLDVLEEHVSYLKPWGQKGTLQILGRVRAPLPTMYSLREMLNNLGWEDTCEGPDVTLRLNRKRKKDGKEKTS